MTSEDASSLLAGAFAARATGSRVDYRILLPAHARPGERLPLILHLHGAMSSAARSLEAARPIYEAAWSRGELPRAVVACATTPTVGGFYIDQADGPRWETLVASEFPEVVARRLDVGDVRAVIGSSMGGYGALKLAFREPERYVAVAALCPAIFPAEAAADVPERNRPSVLGDLHRAMGEDEATYRSNSVHGILRANLDRIRAAGLGVYVDCGDADEFGLHDGALFLHRLLTECAVPHEFHSVVGAGHADAAASRRLADAVAFVGQRIAAR
ncbi:MAG TPA: alpha/beta hydrolase-fold protein [Gemmatimonadaceae bacterium]|nr:alpha/beta hydrolase-fold protein [Gemmatimonadaceae bacterium]